MAAKSAKSKKRLWWGLAVAGILALTIASVVKSRLSDAVEVTVEQPLFHSITETVSASGTIAPAVEVTISSAVSGEIIELPVREGQAVQEGDLLVKINPDLSQAALDRAIASLNNAKASEAAARARVLQTEAQMNIAKKVYDRSKGLLESEAVSQAEFDDAEAAWLGAKTEFEAAQQNALAARFSIAASEATVKEARDSYSRTTLYAPMSGTISRLNVEVGEQVVGAIQMTGTEIMTIADLTAMEVEVEVNESDIVKVSPGDTARIRVDAFPETDFLGLVTEVASSANLLAGQTTAQVTNFLVRIRIADQDYSNLRFNRAGGSTPFRPGMNANVEIETETRPNALCVPISAVTTREDTATTTALQVIKARKGGASNAKTKEADKPLECIFAVEDEKARIIPVETGIQDDEFIEILTPLDSGLSIVTGPYDVISGKLQTGDAVKVKRSVDD